MKIQVSLDKDRYLVDIYTCLRGETYPHWHTCRAFVHQGDAIVFRSICEMGKIDPVAYAKTYNSSRTVSSLSIKEGKVRLNFGNV